MAVLDIIPMQYWDITFHEYITLNTIIQNIMAKHAIILRMYKIILLRR